MKREYLALEIQAIRVGIYGIKPIGGSIGWTIAARDCLLEQFSKSEYFLACSFIEKIHDKYYLVCLCDTNNPEIDLFVHDVLVTENHAYYDEEIFKKDLNSDDDNEDVCNGEENEENTTINISECQHDSDSYLSFFKIINNLLQVT
jgi:hypothetical protein